MRHEETMIPHEIRTALEHVREHYPEVTQVVFFRDGRWRYFTDALEAPIFGPEVDLGFLEAAGDAVTHLPAAYALEVEEL